MKYLKEVTIIFGITMLGEFLNYLLPFPVPSGVYGLFILLLLLCTGALHTEDVAEVGDFFLDTMPIMFIPAGVGLLDSVQEAESILVPLTVITVISHGICYGCDRVRGAEHHRAEKNRREAQKHEWTDSFFSLFWNAGQRRRVYVGRLAEKEDRLGNFKSAAGCNYSCDCIFICFSYRI